RHREPVRPVAVHRGEVYNRDHRDRDRDHDRDRDRNMYRGNYRVPPGLAKKPGHMPPGQYKKMYRRYGTYDGAYTLGQVMRQRGYTVTRIVPSGSSHLVYYRDNYGVMREAIVQPGADRLMFSNVPSSLLQLVLARLY